MVRAFIGRNKQVNLKYSTMKDIMIKSECDQCNATGIDSFSCCGDDMSGADIDICPTCKEHTGIDCHNEGEPCDNCKGTGIEDINITFWVAYHSKQGKLNAGEIQAYILKAFKY